MRSLICNNFLVRQLSFLLPPMQILYAKQLTGARGSVKVMVRQ